MILEADERELQALATLIDAAVRQLGIRGAGDAVIWIQKIETALKGTTNGTMATNGTSLSQRPG